jgi:hypothetical protein
MRAFISSSPGADVAMNATLLPALPASFTASRLLPLRAPPVMKISLPILFLPD